MQIKKENILKDLNNAWLSPTGRIVIKDKEFFAEHTWHDDLAYCILRDIWKLETKMAAFQQVHKEFSTTGIEKLEDKGWIRLHGFGGLTPVWIIPINNRLTNKQETTIQDWCLVNKRNYNTCFSK